MLKLSEPGSDTRLAAGGVKSKAGRRMIGLPPQLVALLRAHQAEQEREQATGRQLWHDEGWVFASPAGKPLIPNTDYHAWKRLLKDAGLRESRLHDARHTAATVLLILGVPVRTVMSIMGWSSAEMAARYQHVTDAIRQDVARQVDGLIWQAPGAATDAAIVTVSRGSLVAILRLAELGLAHGDSTAVAGSRDAIEHIRAVLVGSQRPGTGSGPTSMGETK